MKPDAEALLARIPDALGADEAVLHRWADGYGSFAAGHAEPVVAGHGDFAPRNVHFAGTVMTGVFDWELAGPVFPSVEAAITALDWSRDPAGEVHRPLFDAFLRGYRTTGPADPARGAALTAAAGRLLAWLKHNIARWHEDHDPAHLRNAAGALRNLVSFDRNFDLLMDWMHTS